MGLQHTNDEWTLIPMAQYEDVAVKVLDQLSEVAEVGPVTARELALHLGESDTIVRDAIVHLAVNGMIYGRTETKEERALRFGREYNGRQATLYSTVDPVPKRTTRGVFAGVIESGERVGRGARRAQVLDELRKVGGFITVHDLAQRCSTTDDNASGTLLALYRDHLVERVIGTDSGCLEYRAKTKTKRTRRTKSTASASAATTAAVTTEIVAEDPTPTPAPITTSPSVDLVRAIDAMVESRVAALTADLQADNDRLVAERDAAVAALDEVRQTIRTLGL